MLFNFCPINNILSNFNSLADSVTRFGEISPIWQNLTRYQQVFIAYLLFDILLNLLLQILNVIGQIFTDVNGQNGKII